MFLCVSCSRRNERELAESFLALMGFNKGAWEFVITDDDYNRLQYFQELYEKSKHLIFDEEAEDHIPKVLHFIWLGSSSFPEESTRNVNSWVKHHPDWKIIYWTDRRRPLPHPKMEVRLIEEFDFLELGSCFKKARNYGEQSMILCYEILYREGGLCVHHDVECFRSFDPFHRLDFYCGLSPPDRPTLNSAVAVCPAVMGAKPSHPIIAKSIELMRRYWNDAVVNYPKNNWKELFHRGFTRTTLCLEEAIELAGNREGSCDATFPAGYFNKIDGRFGFFAHHRHESAWLDKETRFERYARSELHRIGSKNDKAMLLAGLALVINLLFIGILISCYRILKRLLRDQD